MTAALPVQRFAVWNRALSAEEIAALYDASGIADDVIDPDPLIDLDFASYVTGTNTIPNKGTAGSSKKGFASGALNVENGVLILGRTQRFSTMYNLKGSEKWTWAVRVGPLSLAGNSIGYVMRGEADLPCVMMSLSSGNWQAKTSGSTFSLSSYVGSHGLDRTHANTFAFACDGAGGVSLYINGKFARKDQNFSGTCASEGCGDTGSTGYAFDSLPIELYQVYDDELNEAQIAAIV